MPLTDKITHAAQNLGSLLNAEPVTQEYLRLVEQAKVDPTASGLEIHYAQLFEELVAQEQSGIPLEPAQMDQYYDLRRQLQEHPVIQARDAQFELVKSLFADTATRMTAILGLDYTAFAR